MDDLLIVRASDRIRPRRHQRRANQVPLGSSLGIGIGAAFGLLGATYFAHSPHIGLLAGITVGIAVGAAIGPLLRPKSKRVPRFDSKHYQGFPHPTEEQEEAEK